MYCQQIYLQYPPKKHQVYDTIITLMGIFDQKTIKLWHGIIQQTSLPGLLPTNSGRLGLSGVSGHGALSICMQICSPYLQDLIIGVSGQSKYVSVS